MIPVSVVPISSAHCSYLVIAGLVIDSLTSYLLKAGIVSDNLTSYLVKAAANLLSDVRLIPSMIPSVRGSMSRQTSLEATSQEMNLEKHFIIKNGLTTQYGEVPAVQSSTVWICTKLIIMEWRKKVIQWKPLNVTTVNVIIWLILSDWKRTGRLNNISNKIIRLLWSELLRIRLLLSV